MNEELLQFIWKMKLFNSSELITTCGLPLKIIKSGSHNRDAGPDFFNARLVIDQTVWAGNIEIHLKTSDWLLHHHQHNPAYENIILHVVYEHDLSNLPNVRHPFYTLWIAPHVQPGIVDRYKNLKFSPKKIPCATQVSKVPTIIIRNMLDKVLLERLAHKMTPLAQLIKEKNGHREEACYIFLSAAFGFKINAVPFELLSKSTPIHVLKKHNHSLVQMEALLFGQAGFLHQPFTEKYPSVLQNEYTYLKHKFHLSGIAKHLWKFSRLRPANFPSIRIAQFAALMHKTNSIYDEIYNTTQLHDLVGLFNVKASDFWTVHYMFNQQSKPAIKFLGKDAVNLLLINAVAPIIFYFATQDHDILKKEFALHVLETIRPEQNNLISVWNKAGINAINAADTQALLELTKNYCENSACTHCNIGYHIMKNN